MIILCPVCETEITFKNYTEGETKAGKCDKCETKIIIPIRIYKSRGIN